MLDLLAAISSVDPPSLLAWLILAFAAAGYPLGIMLGASCSPCCNAPPCGQCTEGELPETLTVTFSGLADQTPGPDLIALSFTSCYGSGASAQVTAPGGDPATDKGPIGAVSLTNGGSGYAVLGRVAPTLTVSGGSGTGATFTATLSQSPDACGLARWAISSIAASGGTDYADGDALTITIAEGDTEVQAASALLYLGREEPEITLDGNATTTVVVTQNYNPGTSPLTWGVASVTVTSGGSGYTEGAAATFLKAADDVEETAATGTIRVVHAEPTNAIVSFYDAATAQPSAGTGATLEPVWQETALDQYDAPNLKKYRLTGMTVTSGGSGYTEGDVIEISFASVDDGGTAAYASITVSGVNGSGGITQVSVSGGGGEYIGSRTDALHSVAMTPSTRGSYYKDLPASRYVVIQNGGLYYREEASEPPYVATVTVGITQTAPSTGTGASLSVTIDEDTGSETFGQITGVTIDNGGSGYLAHELFDTCLTRLDGRTVVLQRNVEWLSNPCSYGYRCQWDRECGLVLEQVSAAYTGPDQPIALEVGVLFPTSSRVDGERIWLLEAVGFMTADELVTDCSDIDVTATGGSGVPEGATAHIVAGGEYEEPDTCEKILLEDLEGVYADVAWGGTTVSGPAGSWCGIDSVVVAPGSSEQRPIDGCEEWKETAQDRVDAHMALGTGEWSYTSPAAAFCEEQEGITSVSARVLRTNDCGWKWQPDGFNNTQYHVCVSIYRALRVTWSYESAGFFTSPTVLGWRSCSWCYPITHIPTDDDLVPSGAVSLGAPFYQKSGTFDFPFWFDDFLTEGNVCVNPGPPTVTFSRLP